jgi:hypothetical protein
MHEIAVATVVVTIAVATVVTIAVATVVVTVAVATVVATVAVTAAVLAIAIATAAAARQIATAAHYLATVSAGASTGTAGRGWIHSIFIAAMYSLTNATVHTAIISITCHVSIVRQSQFYFTAVQQGGYEFFVVHSELSQNPHYAYRGDDTSHRLAHQRYARSYLI